MPGLPERRRARDDTLVDYRHWYGDRNQALWDESPGVHAYPLASAQRPGDLTQPVADFPPLVAADAAPTPTATTAAAAPAETAQAAVDPWLLVAAPDASPEPVPLASAQAPPPGITALDVEASPAPALAAASPRAVVAVAAPDASPEPVPLATAQGPPPGVTALDAQASLAPSPPAPTEGSPGVAASRVDAPPTPWPLAAAQGSPGVVATGPPGLVVDRQAGSAVPLLPFAPAATALRPAPAGPPAAAPVPKPSPPARPCPLPLARADAAQAPAAVPRAPTRTMMSLTEAHRAVRSALVNVAGTLAPGRPDPNVPREAFHALLSQRHPDLARTGAVRDVLFEVVHNVRDPNISHGRRVDVFVHFDTGFILRVHPGHQGNGSQDMRPILLPPGTPVLRAADVELGAGWASRRYAPGLIRRDNQGMAASASARGVAYPGGPAAAAAAATTFAPLTEGGFHALLHADDVDLIPAYDASTNGHRVFRLLLEDVFPRDAEADVDISVHDGLPWWLWWRAGATSRTRYPAGTAVHRATAGRRRGQLFVSVWAVDGLVHTATWGRGSTPAWSVD